MTALAFVLPTPPQSMVARTAASPDASADASGFEQALGAAIQRDSGRATPAERESPLPDSPAASRPVTASELPQTAVLLPGNLVRTLPPDRPALSLATEPAVAEKAADLPALNHAPSPLPGAGEVRTTPEKGSSEKSPRRQQAVASEAADAGTLRAELQYAPTDVLTPLPAPIPFAFTTGELPLASEAFGLTVPLTAPPLKEAAAAADVHLRIKLMDSPDGAVTPLSAPSSGPNLPNALNASKEEGHAPALRPELRPRQPALRPQQQESSRTATGTSGEVPPAKPLETTGAAPAAQSAAPAHGAMASGEFQRHAAPPHDARSQPATVIHHEPQIPEPQSKAPLRTMSFELGQEAGDVKLRLSERGGEVHVSLHSTDATLGHQLREGIHDLASALNSAGYDAEAWAGQSHDQSRQHREQPQDQQYAPGAAAGAREFESLLTQVPQETI